MGKSIKQSFFGLSLNCMSCLAKNPSKRNWPLIYLSLLALLVFKNHVRLVRSTHDVKQQQPLSMDSRIQLLAELRQKDTCGTLITSQKHGYGIHEYKVTTNDKYQLTLHRIIHPSDAGRPGAESLKKPYILLHGLVGSSTSFMQGVEPRLMAPRDVYDLRSNIDSILGHNKDNYEYTWRSMADMLSKAYEGDTSTSYDRLTLTQKLLGEWPKKKFASNLEPDCDGDQLNFGREFKQAYRKFNMPLDSKAFISKSLAFTLSNFGYDVWLVNLRGNSYSRFYNGRGNARDAEYWNFNIDTIIKEDLPASINFVKKATRHQGPVGIVAYSYSNLYLLGLLTKFPAYQDTLQPIVMMAPAALTLTPGRHKFKYTMQLLSKVLVSNNGPFPTYGRSEEDPLERLACHLPLASKMCSLIESILHGRTKSAIQLAYDRSYQATLFKRDISCGQTSTGVLRQILENLNQQNLDPKYQPWIKSRNRQVKRSVMILHSVDDDISTMNEVIKIKDSGLKTMSLVDYIIEEPKFEHTDFLFSQRNQYLVNGEIIRMVSLFDFLADRPSFNVQITKARGY